MTDKQIIIDGKECRYWFRPNPDDYRKCSLRGKNDNCDEIKDCFVKELLGKLALKEQECEALQMSENKSGEIIAELQAYKDINEDFKTAWEELKAENEELKKIINEAKNSKLDLKSFLVGEAIQNEYEQQLDQLKQTLAEIKEIAEECYYECNSMNNCNISCKYYNNCNGEFSYLLAYLNKQISEVEK